MKGYGSKLNGVKPMIYETNIESPILWLPLGNEANNPTFLENAKIKLCRSIWPRRCFNTKRSIWFKIAVRSRRIYRTGDTDVAYEDRWFDTKEFTLMKLRGYC